MLTLDDIHRLAGRCIYDFANPRWLKSEAGLLGVGGDLSVPTLAYAYLHGFFPWFNQDEPIAWWCPEPRCVLQPDDFSAKKSLKRTAKNKDYRITLNHAFARVMTACSLPRAYTDETWIHQQMQDAYLQLHHLGVAHSLEVWRDDVLVGGLYGVKMGACFFGESMFHVETDTSKLAFWALTVLCRQTGVALIDCQLVNLHLLSLGATTMTREAYLDRLDELIRQDGVGILAEDWQKDWSISTQQLLTM